MALVDDMTTLTASPPASTDRSQRRKWTEGDNKILMGYWDLVGSVALIAIMIKRSPSSVQTQASRLGLPPREEDKDRHRRRWADGDDKSLDCAIADLSGGDGKIPIVEVARVVGRSVDAVVARLESRFGNGSDILARLVAPPPPSAPSMPKARPLTDGVRNPHTLKAKIKRCLRTECRREFYSEGAHNWICSNCKRSSDWLCE